MKDRIHSSKISHLRKLVIVHQGALGDFLLAFPVLEGLYRANPDIGMDFWAGKEHAGLIASRPYVGKVHPAGGAELAPFFHEDLWMDAEIPSFFLDSHAILILGQPSMRVLAERLAQRLNCPVHWARSFPGPEDGALPVTKFIAEQIRSLGWHVECVLPRLAPDADETMAVRSFLADRGWEHQEKPVLIHPGSGGRKKIWPLEKWWALLRRLRKDYEIPVLLTLGPADDYLRDFAGEAQRLGAHLVEELSLRRLAAFLAESRLYIGNDSGVSHLAAAMGIPAVVIFGPTNPEIWAPQGPNVHIIRSRWEEAEIFRRSPVSGPPEPEICKVLVHILGVLDSDGLEHK